MDEQARDERLARIEELLIALVHRGLDREYYSTAEVADIVGRAEFTVREWCRLGRIHAEKRPAGRGKSGEWMISRDELRRFQDEGLLPVGRSTQFP